MLRLFTVPFSQNTPSAVLGDERHPEEVSLWLQEHTVLCQAIANAADRDSEAHASLKARLAESAAHGKQLVSALLVQKVEGSSQGCRVQDSSPHAASQNMVPVAGSARGRIAIPLSGGVRRLDEQAPSTHPRTVRSNVTAVAHGQAPLGVMLFPSRTYIKKSGT